MRISFCLLLCLLVFPARAREVTAQKDQPQLVDSVAAVLHFHGSSGGIIELIGCTTLVDDSDEIQPANIDSQLAKLSGRAPLNWNKKAGSYLVEIHTVKQSSIMKVQLPMLNIPDDSLVAISEVLFRQKPVLEALKRSNVRLYDRSLGFTALKAEPGNEAVVLKFPAGTLADDLNWIASRKGPAIWLYRQNSCEGKRVGSFSWLQR
jgi:hypothetical protein